MWRDQDRKSGLYSGNAFILGVPVPAGARRFTATFSATNVADVFLPDPSLVEYNEETLPCYKTVATSIH